MVGRGGFGVGFWAVGFLAAGVGLVPWALADSFHLKDGQVLEGTVLEATLNTVTLKIGGSVRPTSFGQIDRVVLTLADGSALEGELLGWKDGVFEVRSADQVVHVAEGRVLDEAGDAEQAVAALAADAAVLPGAGRDEAPAAPEAAAAPETVAMRGLPTFLMKDGRELVGRILHATGSIVTLRPQGGGVRPVSRSQIEAVRFTAADGEVVSGRLADWSDGVYRLQLPDREVLASLDDDAARAGPPAADAEPAAVAEPAADAGPEIETADAAILPADRPAAADGAVVAGAGGPAIETAVAGLDARAPDEAAAAAGSPHVVETRVEAVGEGSTEVVFQFHLDQPALRPLVILYAATDATAKAGTDFEAKSGVITFAVGSSYAEVRVPLIDDDQSEASEQFNLFLSGDPETIQFTQRQIPATIDDDD